MGLVNQSEKSRANMNQCTNVLSPPRSLCSMALTTLAMTVALLASGAKASQIMQPHEITELGLWISASDLAKEHSNGHSVKRWPDRSGKAYDAIWENLIPQAGLRVGVHQPPTFKTNALGGHPAVSFDAAQRQTLILNRAGHALGQAVSGFSAVFVVRADLFYGPAPATDVAWGKNRYLFISHISNYDTRVSVQIVEGSGEVRLSSRPRPKEKIDHIRSLANGRQLTIKGEAWHRLMVTVDYREKETRIILDGKIIAGTLPPTSLDVFEDVPSPITGIGSNTLDSWLSCQIAEIICYQKALGIDEVRSLDAYLCQRYGLER